MILVHIELLLVKQLNGYDVELNASSYLCIRGGLKRLCIIPNHAEHCYTLLPNLHASVRRWEDVNKLLYDERPGRRKADSNI
ncbi:hypothetical protein CKAN_00117900 [Cinnamomum micranthum f. kanehirae]|uniref:Uncharacterized protein n=1 Tax=Cinnamomum micranthum f. kanehirae TaxID=337451 RepID=A0A3S4N598_9MAGN|nr:hypothetical protein CKAN_00117900 [Cinnamomum micranthum f. kanehirae]